MADTILSCDWGTTNLRLRRLDVETGRVLETATAPVGIRDVHLDWQRSEESRASFYLAALAPVLADVGRRPTDRGLVISGMASSSIGMAELPYATLPFRLDGSDIVVREMDLPALPGPLLLLSGLRSEEDAMRGEETELVGLHSLIEFPDEAVVVLPGTHSKHVRIERGAAVAFTTYLTGELFDVLLHGSILRESVAASAFDADAFAEGALRGRDAPLLGSLFRVRTRELLDDLRLEANYWYLSGLLIGSELSALSDGDPPIVLGGGPQRAYRTALTVLGMDHRALVPDEATAARAASTGHLVAYRRHVS